MPVQVLASTVVAHGGAWIGVAGGDLDGAQSTPASSIVVMKVCLSMCGCMQQGSFTPASSAKRLLSRGTVSIHSGAATGQQDRSGGAVLGGPLDGTTHGRRKWDEGDFVALPADPKDSVAVLFTEVLEQRGRIGCSLDGHLADQGRREAHPIRVDIHSAVPFYGRIPPCWRQVATISVQSRQQVPLITGPIDHKQCQPVDHRPSLSRGGLGIHESDGRDPISEVQTEPIRLQELWHRNEGRASSTLSAGTQHLRRGVYGRPAFSFSSSDTAHSNRSGNCSPSSASGLAIVSTNPIRPPDAKT